MSTTTEHAGVIPSISIEALLAARDQAQRAYTEAKRLLDEAAERLQPFGVSLPKLMVEFGGGSYRDVRSEDYREAIENEVDRFVWVRLFALTNIDTLMDHDTRRKLFERLHKTRAYMADQDDALPPLTAENIEATFRAVREQMPEYFELGIEATYRSLSWKHRTNEPGRIGEKLIITGAFYHQKREWQEDYVTFNHHEALHDLERICLLLDKQAPATYETGLRSLGKMEWGKWYDVPGTTGDPLLRVKSFRKGTTHVQIAKRSLVDHMNRVMARRYPGAIPEPAMSKAERAAEHPQPEKPTSALTVKKARQSFYTPEELAEQVVEAASVSWGTRVLEPSAGAGALCRAAFEAKCENVTAVENNPEALELLEQLAARVNKRCEKEHPAMRLRAGDFLSMPAPTDSDNMFDAVVMNPPFANEREVEHVLHAWSFVRPGGRLVSIMSAGAKSRTDGRYGALGSFLRRHGAEVTELPAGAFKESGTDVRTVLVAVEKPE